MDGRNYGSLTQEQRDALWAIWNRPGPKPTRTFLAFVRSALNDRLMGCMMVPWRGMWLGIEPDGHTHS